MSEIDQEKAPSPKDKLSLQQPQDQSPPASLTDIINVIADRVEPVLQIITTVAERSLKANEVDARFRVRMAWVAVFVITLIVGRYSYLCW